MPQSTDARAGTARALIVLTVVAFALGAAWFLLGRDPARAPEEDVERVAAPAAGTEPEAGGAVEVQPPADAGVRTAVAPRTQAVEGASDPAEAPTPDRTEGLFARAVDGTGAPVPNASLEWVMESRFGGVGDGYVRGATGADGVLELVDADELLGRAFGTGPLASLYARIGL
ncbi:MAG: hypothetical protein AAFP86_22275, partial [Planctomycetota bacterium]